MLLMPSSSALVVLDGTPLLTAPATAVMARITPLIDAALLLAAPALVARHPMFAFGAASPTLLHPALPATPYDLDMIAVDFSTTVLGRTIAATGRTQIVVCGLWLEDAVTLTALRAFSVGFDVYVPVDAVLAHDPSLAPIAHDRLAHAGVVLTTAAQTLREWAALVPSTASSDSLQKLILTMPSPSP